MKEIDAPTEKLQRIMKLWSELQQTADGSTEYEALLQRIHDLSAEYQALINATKGPNKPK
jgi:hypothetical protein